MYLIVVFFLYIASIQAKFHFNKNKSKTLFDPSTNYSQINGSSINYQTFHSSKQRDYTVRFVQPELCDVKVIQYAGYFDLGKDIHYYFWFFESKSQASSSPLTVWLNGGPGCSSMIGLWQENGPCRASTDGSIEFNPHSWTLHSNMLYLDQPVGAGFSYGAAMNITDNPRLFYDAVQLFYEAFPQYSTLPFHLFGESFAGRYIPVYADYIVKRNRENEALNIPIESVGIGNGWINPLTQFKYGSTMACGSDYGPVLPPNSCHRMDLAYRQCAQFIQECYETDDSRLCFQADNYCTSNIDGVFGQSHRSYYDIRKPEGTVEPPQDYISLLNQADLQKAIGVNPMRFEECANGPFFTIASTGESARNSAPLLSFLLNNGIRVLNYVGDADYLCNWYGVYALTLELEHKDAKLFDAQMLRPWVYRGVELGQIQSINNLAFIRVYEAGHEVPYYQPEAALLIFDYWVNKKTF
ncbi:hypothetical protein RMCBS344292_00259 [Rhizopus microsporus]|nr:hypothetical protein RMCBS344292_00259 [Rhizopus microsporus]